MNIFNEVVRTSYIEQLRSQNLDEKFIIEFDNKLKLNMKNAAIDMLVYGATKNKELCDVGKKILDLCLTEEEENKIDESLFNPKPLHDFDKLAITKTKIKDAIFTLTKLLGDKPARSPRASKANNTSNSSKTNAASNTTSKKKNTVSIKKGSVVNENKPPIIADTLESGPPVFSDLLVEKISEQKEESDDEPDNKFNNSYNSDEESFMPGNNIKLINNIKIDSQSISDSLSFKNPFNIGERTNNNNN